MVFALIIRSKYFGHLYAHHHELENILVLLPHMVCNILFAGGRRSPDRRPPVTKALPYAAITQVYSRSPDDGHISARNILSGLYVQKPFSNI